MNKHMLYGRLIVDVLDEGDDTVLVFMCGSTLRITKPESMLLTAAFLGQPRVPIDVTFYLAPDNPYITGEKKL